MTMERPDVLQQTGAHALSRTAARAVTRRTMLVAERRREPGAARAICALSLAFVAGCVYYDDPASGTDAGGAPDAGADAGNDVGVVAPADAGDGCAWGRTRAGTCDDPVELAAGCFHTCARRASETVVC